MGTVGGGGVCTDGGWERKCEWRAGERRTGKKEKLLVTMATANVEKQTACVACAVLSPIHLRGQHSPRGYVCVCKYLYMLQSEDSSGYFGWLQHQRLQL